MLRKAYHLFLVGQLGQSPRERVQHVDQMLEGISLVLVDAQVWYLEYPFEYLVLGGGRVEAAYFLAALELFEVGVGGEVIVSRPLI